jgi:hypothetical protein
MLSLFFCIENALFFFSLFKSILTVNEKSQSDERELSNFVFNFLFLENSQVQSFQCQRVEI